MDNCDHIVGLSIVPDCEGCVRRSSLTSGEFAHETRQLFAFADQCLKPEARRRPDESPSMTDDEIISRYVRPFSHCPNCGKKLLPPPYENPSFIEGDATFALPTHVTKAVGRHSDDTPNPGYQPDIHQDVEDVRRDDFEAWANGYWPHLHQHPPDFTRHADGYHDHELQQFWYGWRMHLNWLRWGEGGEDRGRDHMREMVFAHFKQTIEAAAHKRPSEYQRGYLHAQLTTYAMCGVISKTEWDAYQDRLDALGIGSRMQLPDSGEDKT